MWSELPIMNEVLGCCETHQVIKLRKHPSNP